MRLSSVPRVGWRGLVLFGRWFTLSNVGQLADLAVKVAAIVAAAAAINFFSADADVEIVSARCRSVIDERALVRTVGFYTPAMIATARRFPEETTVFSTANSTVVTPPGERTNVNCRRHFFEVTKKLRKRSLWRSIVETYGLPGDAIPRDFFKVVFQERDPPIEEYDQAAILLGVMYLRADVIVLNRGGGTATDITITSPTFAMRGASFRLRSDEQRTVTAATRPGTLGFRNGDMSLKWDAERDANETLIRWLVYLFGAVFIASSSATCSRHARRA